VALRAPLRREVDVGKTLSETEYIGMCRREVLDAYLRDRAKGHGARVANGLFMRMEQVGHFAGRATRKPSSPCTHACMMM
jgi:geranylgeranyl reductase